MISLVNKKNFTNIILLYFYLRFYISNEYAVQKNELLITKIITNEPTGERKNYNKSIGRWFVRKNSKLLGNNHPSCVARLYGFFFLHVEIYAMEGKHELYTNVES